MKVIKKQNLDDQPRICRYIDNWSIKQIEISNISYHLCLLYFGYGLDKVSIVLLTWNRFYPIKQYLITGYEPAILFSY